MRTKYARPPLPTLFFREGVLSVPGYYFDKVRLFLALPVPIIYSSRYSSIFLQATAWEDTGSMTLLSEGTSLKDGTNVLAKIAPAHSNASMCLEREAHVYVSPHPVPSHTSLPFTSLNLS